MSNVLDLFSEQLNAGVIPSDIEATYTSFFKFYYDKDCPEEWKYKDWREMPCAVTDVEGTSTLPNRFPDWSNLQEVKEFHFKCYNARICQISSLITTDRRRADQNYNLVDVYNTYVNPEIPIPPDASKVNHIFDDDVKDAPKFADIVSSFMSFIADANIICAFNGVYDMNMINLELLRAGYKPSMTHFIVIDPMVFSRIYKRGDKKSWRHSQEEVAKRYGVGVMQEIANKTTKEKLHNSLVDCKVLADLLYAMGKDRIPWELGNSIEKLNEASIKAFSSRKNKSIT